ncbi:MAG: hypothetical protein KC416_16480, partial [Myxococcales bacterium]|nr:hypothetical protein [Myxococcales bacterium]
MRTLWTLGVGLALLLMAVGCQQDDGGAGMDQKVGPDGGNGTDLPPDNSLMPPDRDGDATMGDPNNPGPITGVAPPGGPCTCDDQCEGTDTNPGLCVQGVCMQEASSACTSGGSTEQCPAGSQCWGLE